MIRLQMTEIKLVQSPISSCLPQPASILFPEFCFWNKHQIVSFLHFETSGHYSTHKSSKSWMQLKGLFITWYRTMFQSPETFSLQCARQASYLEAGDPLRSLKKCSKGLCAVNISEFSVGHDKSVQAKLKCQVLSFWLEVYQLRRICINQKLWLAVDIICWVITALDLDTSV